MRKRWLAVSGLALLVVSCAPRVEYRWNPYEPKAATEFKRDKAACKYAANRDAGAPPSYVLPAPYEPVKPGTGVVGAFAQGLERSNGTTNLYNSLAYDKRVEALFEACMAAQGWYLEEVPKDSK